MKDVCGFVIVMWIPGRVLKIRAVGVAGTWHLRGMTNNQYDTARESRIYHLWKTTFLLKGWPEAILHN
jgi:hypothetical protein